MARPRRKMLYWIPILPDRNPTTALGAVRIAERYVRRTGGSCQVFRRSRHRKGWCVTQCKITPEN